MTGPRLYGRAWSVARSHYLRGNPLCVFCERVGRLTPATVVDHIQPHKGDAGLFWDPSNWQSLCKPCHDGAKHSTEVRGVQRGCDAEGMPLDPNHHWSK